MGEFKETLVKEIKRRVSIKTLFAVIIVFLILEFEIKNNLAIEILKTSWIGITLTVLIIAVAIFLVYKSNKVGYKEYESNKSDFKYSIQNKDIEIQINTYDKWLMPHQEIILYNNSGHSIDLINGHIDFYKENTRFHMINFNTKDLPKDKSHLILKLKDNEILRNWNYSVINIDFSDESNNQYKVNEKGEYIMHLPDFDYLYVIGNDLRWLKYSINRLIRRIKNNWRIKIYVSFEATKEQIKEYKKEKVLCLFRRLLIILIFLLAIFLTITIVFFICIFMKNFIIINYNFLVDKFK
ncbi:MAG: hypothetical protein J1E85_10545 [Ruminococcus sp.]|nr:hypothetical protein [Ruminococcus sp.]